MDKYIGRLLDNRYEILEIIGTGGMAVVYKARCHRLNRLVAIKILKDDYLQDEEFRRRFHSESQAVAMLGHPNIVAVYDVSTSIMADYIVMELIDGITLKQYMEKKGVLNWKETLHFAIQIAKALEHAHSKGIVHRDIKPHNIMVLKNGSVKVTDFGIARMMSKGNTLTKEALGSVHYISPEQAKGGRVDSRSDIYSLGVVMYEMMTGRPPYDGESPVAVAIQHINGGAVMPSTLNHNIPGGLEQIIMKAMAHGIEQRYGSTSAMLSDMDEFRKNPAMLFDYNVPPLDDVTKIVKQIPIQEEPPATVAERVVRRTTEGKRQSTPAAGGVRQLEKTGSPEQRKPVRKKPADTEEKRSRVATIAIVSCSLVMVVAIVIFLVVLLGDGSFGSRNSLSEVPQLVGKQYSTLGTIYGDFQIELAERVYDDEVPEGDIVSQEPKAGEFVAKGVSIFVTVSKGPEEKQEVKYMPDVLGRQKAVAEVRLKDLDVRVVFEEESSDTVPEGCVVRTEPEKDAQLTPGQEVRIWISQGPMVKTGSMPNVIGEKKEDAAKILDRQGLKIQIKYEEVFHSTVEEGFVIESDPIAGGDVETGSEVVLKISKGPELQNMPNCVGMDISTASKILVDAGFATPKIEYVPSEKKKDTVVEQSEEANVMIDVKSQITLKISQGTDTTETTQPAAAPKDIMIDLQGSTAGGECLVTVWRDGVKVFEKSVAKGTPNIVLSGQTGSGTAIYEVIVDDQGGDEKRFEHRETF